MKKLIGVAFALFLALSLNAQQKDSQKNMFQASYNNLKELVKSKEFKFIGEVVYNNKNREILKPEENTVSIKSSELSVNLKPLNSDNFTQFSGSYENYIAAFDDEKQIITVEFSIDNNRLYFRVMPNSNVFLTLKNNSGKTITQSGKFVKQ